MAIKVTVFDTRLEGRTPPGSSSAISFEVQEGTPINDFFNRIGEISKQYKGISTLYLMTQMATTEFGGGNSGLLFCGDGIHADNVQQFERLAGQVEHIVLFECARSLNAFDIQNADIMHSELSKTFHGDGDELCRAIARSAGAKVTVVREASEYVADDHLTTFSGYELYCEAGAIDFSDWEGSIISFDEYGNILDQVTNPMSWRDSHGLIQDPRLEPEP